MKRVVIFFVALLIGELFLGNAFFAQDNLAAKTALQKKLDSIPANRKKEIRKQLRAMYDSLPPEQKQKIKQEIKNKIDSLSPEQKKQLRQTLRSRRNNSGN